MTHFILNESPSKPLFISAFEDLMTQMTLFPLLL